MKKLPYARVEFTTVRRFDLIRAGAVAEGFDEARR
jgi:hypothetical protein